MKHVAFEMQHGVGAGHRQPEGYKPGKKGVLFFFVKIKNKKIKKATVQSHDGHMEGDGAFLGFGWQAFSAVLTTVEQNSKVCLTGGDNLLSLEHADILLFR